MLAQELPRRLLTDALGAREAVGRVAPQGDEVGHLGGLDAVARADAIGADLDRPVLRPGREENSDRVGDALEHVAVAGEQERGAAGLLLDRGEAAEQVVRLQLLVPDERPAEGPEERPGVGPLGLELVGHLGAVGVVGRE